MRSLRSYSVFNLHSVASLGLHQTQVADSFMWEYKARKENIISHIFQAVKSHESSGNLPNQPRVIRCQHIGHHGRDRRHWIPNELKHIWLHHGIFENVCYPFLKIYSFVWHFGCCQFDLVSGFCRIVTPTLYCARSLLVAQSNPINISFSGAITQHNYGGRLNLLGIIFFISSTLDTYCMCNCATTSVGLEGVSANCIRFMACIASGDSALRLDRLESSSVRSAISNSDSSSTFRDIHYV